MSHRRLLGKVQANGVEGKVLLWIRLCLDYTKHTAQVYSVKSQEWWGSYQWNLPGAIDGLPIAFNLHN